MGTMVISNVVNKKNLRRVQTDVLGQVAEYLALSFGPFGSNTVIKAGENSATTYTKDGHDILSKIKYNGPIETAILDDLVDITRHVVKTVGDGTTSAIEMSNEIFKAIAKYEGEHDYSAYDIIFAFKEAVKLISDAIKANGRECTVDDIYDIAYTATNGNERLAENLTSLYRDYGSDIYIDLQVSTNSPEDIIKIYDGVTLNAGYTDGIFVNRPNNTCEMYNPHIYVFADPVDTPEMINFFDKIIYENVIVPLINPGKGQTVPTVIIAPRISNDMSGIFTKLANTMMRYEMHDRPPIAIVTAFGQDDEVSDVATLCGATKIAKYINPEIQEKDIAEGLAPTMDTVTTFFGSCEKIVISNDNTKIIKPSKMYNDDGSYTETTNSLITWLETEMARVKAEGGSDKTIYNLRRRINCIKSNLIEYFVGGISVADRDNDRALLEDAIKNCRSAMLDGVGYGANVEGWKASRTVYADLKSKHLSGHNKLIFDLVTIIENAYHSIENLLYSCDPDIISKLIEQGPYNLRTKEFDQKVKSSISSDVVILDAISKIITLMATSNQFILPDPRYNIYMTSDDLENM